MITFDHWRLVRRDLRELKKFRDWLMAAQPRIITGVVVTHLSNRRCCRKEKWRVTARQLTKAIGAPVPTRMINLGDVS